MKSKKTRRRGPCIHLYELVLLQVDNSTITYCFECGFYFRYYDGGSSLYVAEAGYFTKTRIDDIIQSGYKEIIAYDLNGLIRYIARIESIKRLLRS